MDCNWLIGGIDVLSKGDDVTTVNSRKRVTQYPKLGTIVPSPLPSQKPHN